MKDYHSDSEAEKSSDIVTVNGSLQPIYQNPAMENRNGLLKRLASVSNQLKRLTSASGESKAPRLDRSKSTAGQALKGLKFISKTDGGAGWTAVEKRFVKITATTDGLLLRSKFGECIGKKL